MTYCRNKLAWTILLDKWWVIPQLFVPALWAFSIYQKIPEIPVGKKMEHDFLVCSIGNFPEQTEFLKK